MGRLYGRERFLPGTIIGQIAALQLLFYATFGVASWAGCAVVGLEWPLRLITTDEYYDGEGRALG
jgi:hypothetical protein